MKPKVNYAKQPAKDCCQTPPYALVDLLLECIIDYTVWESACGEGYLVKALRDKGVVNVVGTDIKDGYDFYREAPPSAQIQVTNPPYSHKYHWLERSYELNMPFALLMPLEALGAQAAQKLFSKHGMELIVLSKRIDFKMPNKGWDGKAQFPVGWFTWGLGLPSAINYANVNTTAKINWHNNNLLLEGGV